MFYINPEGKTVMKVGDFGLSVLVTPGEKLEQACGTPNYIAPEMWMGLPYDKQVWVGLRVASWGKGGVRWSAGIGFFELHHVDVEWPTIRYSGEGGCERYARGKESLMWSGGRGGGLFCFG